MRRTGPPLLACLLAGAAPAWADTWRCVNDRAEVFTITLTEGAVTVVSATGAPRPVEDLAIRAEAVTWQEPTDGPPRHHRFTPADGTHQTRQFIELVGRDVVTMADCVAE